MDAWETKAKAFFTSENRAPKRLVYGFKLSHTGSLFSIQFSQLGTDVAAHPYLIWSFPNPAAASSRYFCFR